MAKTTITINAKDSNGKKITNNITYVNPEITDANALILAQKISSLTSDSYVSSDRTNIVELDTIPKPVPMPFIMIMVPNADNPDSYTIISNYSSGVINLTRKVSKLPRYNGNASFYISFYYSPNIPILPQDKEFTSSTGDNWTLNPIAYNFNNGQPYSMRRFYLPSAAIPTTPQTVTLKCFFPSVLNYTGRDITLILNITPDEGGNERKLIESKEEEY